MLNLSSNAQRILNYLVAMLPNVKPGNPKTHITYGDLHAALGLPGNANQLEELGMGELSEKLFALGHPGISGLIVNKESRLPGPGYFKLYGRKNLDTPWWEDEIKRVKNFDWSPFITFKQPKASAPSAHNQGGGSPPPADDDSKTNPDELSSDASADDLSTFKITWSNNWSDYIPVRWIVGRRAWTGRSHLTTTPEGQRRTSFCDGKIDGHIVDLEYGGDNEAANKHAHHIGTLRLTYKRDEDGSFAIANARWREKNEPDFNEDAVTVEVCQDPFSRLVSFDPETFEEARIFAMRAVAVRRGQREFRQTLLNAWRGRCAVTGCEIQDILEAAHIVPHAVIGDKGNDASNGLLLRADIHTLFDMNLIRITPDYVIETDASIRKGLLIPEQLCKNWFPKDPAQHPSPDALNWRSRSYGKAKAD